jgi:hypothetical protein
VLPTARARRSSKGGSRSSPAAIPALAEPCLFCLGRRVLTSPLPIWSAVVNGIVAVPVMIMIMLITFNRTITGGFTISGHRLIVG